jgi:CDP-glucose 4,6-dehydratase
VAAVAQHFTAAWGGDASWKAAVAQAQSLHEAATLRLDSSRARLLLGWTPRWRITEAIGRTARWYRDFYAGQAPQQLMQRDLDAYFA